MGRSTDEPTAGQAQRLCLAWARFMYQCACALYHARDVAHGTQCNANDIVLLSSKKASLL